MRRHGSPEAITTDGLRSFKAAMAELGNVPAHFYERVIEPPFSSAGGIVYILPESGAFGDLLAARD